MTFRKRKHIHPFYPEAEKWTAWKYPKQQSTGVKKIKQVSIHRIIVPEPELIEALKIIKKNSVHIPTKKGRVGIRKKDLAIAMYGDDSKQNLTKLQRNITQKLKKPWFAIDIFDKVSRSDWISLNNEGIYLRYVLKNEEIY